MDEEHERELQYQERGELSQFITETITQIATGLFDSQDVVGDLGGQVNPIGLLDSSNTAARIALPGNRVGYIQDVEFDIAISRSSEKDASGGGGVRVLGASIGGGVSSGESEVNASHVRFKVPIVFPGQPNEETEQERKERLVKNRHKRSSGRRRNFVTDY